MVDFILELARVGDREVTPEQLAAMPDDGALPKGVDDAAGPRDGASTGTDAPEAATDGDIVAAHPS